MHFSQLYPSFWRYGILFSPDKSSIAIAFGLRQDPSLDSPNPIIKAFTSSPSTSTFTRPGHRETIVSSLTKGTQLFPKSVASSEFCCCQGWVFVWCLLLLANKLSWWKPYQQQPCAAWSYLETHFPVWTSKDLDIIFHGFKSFNILPSSLEFSNLSLGHL